MSYGPLTTEYELLTYLICSVADLTPIPLPPDASVLSEPEGTLSTRLRGRVNQQVGEIAGSANKVLSDVMDSSFSRLRGFLGSDPQALAQSNQGDTPISPTAESRSSPGFGLLRRGSGFSIASMAASLPGTGVLKDRRLGGAGGSIHTPAEENGQQLVEVSSRAGSTMGGDSDEEETDDSDGEEESEEEEDDAAGAKSDVRSIRSFGSMISRDSREERRQRKSLTDRLANVSARFSTSGGVTGGSASRDTSIRKVHLQPRTSRFTLAYEFNLTAFATAIF